jgi:hypothetical protein
VTWLPVPAGWSVREEPRQAVAASASAEDFLAAQAWVEALEAVAARAEAPREASCQAALADAVAVLGPCELPSHRKTMFLRQ